MFYKFLILFFLLIHTVSISQEQEVIFQFRSNPTDSGYWWLEKNNSGI